jgi:gamma-glutamyltranspeptidase/glutathione hydrolase
MYGGALGKKVVDRLTELGGTLTMDDLMDFKTQWIDPVAATYRGRTIHVPPPPCEAFQYLLTLRILEGFDLGKLPRNGVEHIDTVLRAIRIAAGVRIANSAPSQQKLAELLSDGHVESLRARVRDGKPVAGPTEQWTPPANDGHTTSFSIADKHGNMVCVTQSLGSVFGSGVVVPGTGIALNNRGSCFVTTPGHPNQVGPGKRPLHTIIPGFMTKDGAALTAFGVMGAEMQPQGHVQVVSRMLVSNQNPQAAIDAPRWRVVGEELWIEEQMPQEARRGLAARGHRLTPATDLDFGAAQIIRRVDGGYVAGSESRRDGCAAGF